MTEAEEYKLYRLCDLTKNRVGFVLPVFIASRGANALYKQVIGIDTSILRFEVFEADDASDFLHIAHSAERAFRVGDQAAFALIRRNGHQIIGTKNEVAREVSNAEIPELVSELGIASYGIVNFSSVASAIEPSLREAFRQLGGEQSESARFWRDYSVLMPAIRRQLSSDLEKGGISKDDAERFIEKLSISVDKSYATILAPSVEESMKSIVNARGENPGPGLLQIAGIWGLRSFVIEFKSEQGSATVRETPQGGVISPIVMGALHAGWSRRGAQVASAEDDFISLDAKLGTHQLSVSIQTAISRRQNSGVEPLAIIVFDSLSGEAMSPIADAAKILKKRKIPTIGLFLYQHPKVDGSSDPFGIETLRRYKAFFECLLVASNLFEVATGSPYSGLNASKRVEQIIDKVLMVAHDLGSRELFGSRRNGIEALRWTKGVHLIGTSPAKLTIADDSSNPATEAYRRALCPMFPVGQNVRTRIVTFGSSKYGRLHATSQAWGSRWFRHGLPPKFVPQIVSVTHITHAKRGALASIALTELDVRNSKSLFADSSSALQQYGMSVLRTFGFKVSLGREDGTFTISKGEHGSIRVYCADVNFVGSKVLRFTDVDLLFFFGSSVKLKKIIDRSSFIALAPASVMLRSPEELYLKVVKSKSLL